MDQELIDRLWDHSRRMDAENAHRFSALDPEGAPDLFLSFHPEGSNANRHSHEFFELLYVCRGEPVGVIDEQEIRLVEGSLCIMNPNAFHWFRKYEEATDLVLNIVLPRRVFQKTIFRVLFTDPVLNTFFLRYQLESGRPPSFLFLPHLDRDVDGLVSFLVKEYLDPARYSRVVIDSLLTLLFSLLIRAYGERVRHEDGAVAAMTEHIYRNYQTVTLEDLAVRFNYHPKYLSTLLHRATGQTFRHLVASIKLQNAANLLLFSDEPVERVAERVGYKDKSGFHAGFRRAYGLTPTEYRRRNA